MQASNNTVHNFNSGPSILPQPVFQQAAEAIINFNNTGLSILEIGHRTPLFQEVMDRAVALAKDLMGLDERWEVLFLHGGATTQFFQVPMNFLNANQTAGYTDGGTWGKKAIKEAKLFGNVNVLASSADKNYTYLAEFEVPEDLAYLHLTSNNTIEGTQIHQWPDTSVPMVCDMSSDILSRQLDFNRFSLIYAGAQKNIGAAGVNMVAIRNDLPYAERINPSMMDYRQHIANGSMLNTPPVFAVYVCMLTLQWLKDLGGIAAIEPINAQKAALLYQTLDELPLFTPTVRLKDRSLMNVVWIMQDESLQRHFLAEAKSNGIVGIKGHRSVGGFRASLYNALPLSSVQYLASFMQDFAVRYG